MSKPVDQHADVTLFDAGFGATHALTVDALPTAVGRWQPVRAGVVNSWAWVDEQFLFSNGWCALVGPNGSGKSLTSGQWFPTMIDGDTTPAALSMSQRGAGNLADRHHNRTPGREKTGVWWLEFGLHAPDDALRWTTLGLWIRWRGDKAGTLDRAWFIAPGRVGADLHLHTDDAPVDLEGLCQQLAACQGQIFTKPGLHRSASRYLTVNDETAYADAVRTELFPGTDRDQMTALTTVLRALRSVRVNDRMTAGEMHALLTAALPALSSRYVELLAKNLAQSDDLLNKANTAKQEHELLTKLSSLYRSYADTAAAATGHALLAAAAEVKRVEGAAEKLTRDMAANDRQLQEASEAKQVAEQRLEELRVTGELLRRRTEGHPGSHLPELAAAVDAAHETAALATATAEERRAESDDATKEEQKAVDTFQTAVRQLTNITDTLREHARRAAADAFCEPFDMVTTKLTGDLDEPTTVAETDLSTLTEPVETWIHHRETVINQTRRALATATAREEAEAEAGDKHAAAVDELNAAERGRRAHQEKVGHRHDDAVQRLRAFGEQHAAVLGAVPVQLLAAVPLEPDAVEKWADQALDEAITKIDLAGATVTADKAKDIAEQAAARLREAETTVGRAGAEVQQVASALQDTIRRVPQPPQTVTRWIEVLHQIDVNSDASFGALAQGDAALQDASERGEALRGAAEALSAAQRLAERAAADAQAAEATATKLQQARNGHEQQLARRDTAVAAFLQQVARWRTSLQVLTLQPHEIPTEADARDGDLSAYQIHLATALRRAEASLREELEPARRTAHDLMKELAALDAAIAEAETEEQAPDAPSWRADRSDRRGAPLWALVDFAPDIDDQQRAAIEGALLAGGILDAWVDADADTIAGDFLLRSGKPVTGRSLADVLVAQPTDTISAEQIIGILRQISYDGQHHADGIALVGEQLRSDWATAAAPADWQPQYIGASTRAERRRRLLDSLRQRRVPLAEKVDQAQARVVAIEGRFETLAAEATLPDFGDLMRQRVTLGETQTALSIAQAAHGTAAKRAGDSRDEAQTARQTATEACDLACTPTDPQAVAEARTACAELVHQLHVSRSRAETLAAAMADQAGRADQKASAEQAADAARKAAEDAEHRDQQARTSRAALGSFDELRDAIAGLREGDTVLEQASAAEAAARSELERCRADAAEARRRLKTAATTKDGRQLPMEERRLDEFNQEVRHLARTVDAWITSAQRLFFCRGTAQAARDVADTASKRALKAAEIARGKQAHAKTEQHKLDEERRLHEKSFQDLLDEHERNGKEQEQARDAVAQHDADARRSAKEAARLEERATTLQASLAEARRSYDDAHSRLLELFDYELIDDVTDGDTYAPPGDPDAATAVARRLVKGFPADTVGDQLRHRAARLNLELRSIAPVFIRMGRLITDEEFGTGGLRRIVLTDSDTTADAATSARPLRQAVADIGRRLQALQRDYDEQLRTEIKGALFTQLRAQIIARIEQAQQIVAGISATLKGVRTGVERVGVRLAWVERRDDPIAQEALSHIQGPNLDGNFDAMYEFFIARLRDDASDEPASERIARVFDYRTWFTWRVEVTHRAFSDETHPDEVFREITLRKNPLDSLSTGEKRLASMLPLLAAVKSFYSTPGFVGPRMAFVDELDAALDQTNLRTLLALLREWDLDVLATLPTMGKLLVPEVQTTAIHKIVKNPSGARFSMPYIWRGSGLPDAVRIAIPEQRSSRTIDGVGGLR